MKIPRLLLASIALLMCFAFLPACDGPPPSGVPAAFAYHAPTHPAASVSVMNQEKGWVTLQHQLDHKLDDFASVAPLQKVAQAWPSPGGTRALLTASAATVPESAPPEDHAPWWETTFAAILSGGLAIAAMGLRSYRRSAAFKELGIKQRIFLDIVSIAVTYTWRAKGKAAKQRAEKENRKMNDLECHDLQMTAANQVRDMAEAKGIHDMPEVQRVSLLNAAIDAEVERKKEPSRQRLGMKGSRG